jgi:hypothetical protein
MTRETSDNLVLKVSVEPPPRYDSDEEENRKSSK